MYNYPSRTQSRVFPQQLYIYNMTFRDCIAFFHTLTYVMYVS